MLSLFPELSSLGFFYSSFILHQLLVPFQPPETWQEQQTLSSLSPTHKTLRHHMNPVACPSQLFFSSASVTAVAPTPGLCVSHHSWAGTGKRHFPRREEHAETARLQLTPSHTPPESLPLTPKTWHSADLLPHPRGLLLQPKHNNTAHKCAENKHHVGLRVSLVSSS